MKLFVLMLIIMNLAAGIVTFLISQMVNRTTVMNKADYCVVLAVGGLLVLDAIVMYWGI